MSGWAEKRRVMRKYDLLAEVYDLQYGEEQNAKITALLRLVSPGPGDLVLDEGCGTGLLFPHLSGRAKLLVGLDISLEALRKAKEKAKQLDNVALVRADADFVPFPDHTFDFVFAITLLQNMPDPGRTVREMGRVGRPGAPIALTALKKRFSWEGFLEILWEGGLEPDMVGDDEGLKDYIVVCRNSAKENLKRGESITLVGM